MRNFHQIRSMALLFSLVALLLGTMSSFAADNHVSKPFSGHHVNGGTVTFAWQGDKRVLTLSDDFEIPDTPDPHWQVVDSKGNAYLLQRLKLDKDKVNKNITLPSYIRDVAKVQIWCAFVEANLGEAPFDKPQK